MPIPSTPTLVDSMAEHKALKLDINALKAEKETLKNDCSHLAEALTSMREEFGKHVGISALKDAVIENMRKKAKKEVEDATDKRDALEEQARVHGLKAESLKKTHEQLTSEIEHKRETLGTVVETLRSETENLNEFRKLKDSQIVEASNALHDIEKKATSAKEALASYEQEYKTKHDFIVEEEKRLSERYSDLVIYEERLRKKCLELYPEMEIIL